METNLVSEFVAAWCEKRAGALISIVRIWDAFIRYCRSTGVTPTRPEQFFSALGDMDARIKVNAGFVEGLWLRTEIHEQIRRWSREEEDRGLSAKPTAVLFARMGSALAAGMRQARETARLIEDAAVLFEESAVLWEETVAERRSRLCSRAS